MIYGLRPVYSESGYIRAWPIYSNENAAGYLIINSFDLEQLRRAHQVHLASYEAVKLKAQPVTVRIVRALAKKIWYGVLNHSGIHDVQLRCFLVLGLGMVMSFDEISKLSMENESMNSNGTVLLPLESIKSSTVQRNYSIREWEGHTLLHSTVLIGPLTAVRTWLTICNVLYRRPFCDYHEKRATDVVNRSSPLSSWKFVLFFRLRLRSNGIGPNDVEMNTCHSIKWRSV